MESDFPRARKPCLRTSGLVLGFLEGARDTRSGGWWCGGWEQQLKGGWAWDGRPSSKTRDEVLPAIFCHHKKNLVKWNREQKDRWPRWEMRVEAAYTLKLIRATLRPILKAQLEKSPRFGECWAGLGGRWPESKSLLLQLHPKLRILRYFNNCELGVYISFNNILNAVSPSFLKPKAPWNKGNIVFATGPEILLASLDLQRMCTMKWLKQT